LIGFYNIVLLQTSIALGWVSSSDVQYLYLLILNSIFILYLQDIFEAIFEKQRMRFENKLNFFKVLFTRIT